jgi:hypothetical protein
MSSINVNTIKSRLGGPPTLPSGVVVSAAATFSNDVSIGGTLTYEDVTNVDAVGLITARSGIKFGAAGIGGTIAANGNTTLAGVVTASQFVGDGSGLTNLVGTGVTNNVNTVNLNVISGISTFGGDVSIADKIIHTGDTNTAIRFPTADTITAETAGSEVIRITSDGDIGIDQSTPRSRLDVFESTTGDQTAIRVGNTNTPSSANDKRIEFVDGTGTTEGTNKFTYGYIQGLRAGGANSGDLIFGTKRSNGAAPVEAMRLDDSGYLGIGTAIPESELHVMESKSGGSSHASSQLTLERDGTNYLQFMTANNGTSGILFGDVADNDGTKIKYDHNTTNMLFETEAAERLRITTSGVEVTGLTSTTSFSVGPGLIQEKSAVPAAALTGTVNFDIVDDGMVHWHYTNASASWVVNLRGDASTTFNSLMDIGKTAVFTLYSASNNTSYYMTDFKIDGASITERWNGGSAPSAATGSGTDVYTFNIFKTGDAAYTVYATFSNFA